MNDLDSKLLSENYRKVQEGMFDRAAAHTAGATSGWGQSLKGAGRSVLGAAGKALGSGKRGASGFRKKLHQAGGRQERAAGKHFDNASQARTDAKVGSLTGGAIVQAKDMATELQVDMRKVLDNDILLFKSFNKAVILKKTRTKM